MDAPEPELLQHAIDNEAGTVWHNFLEKNSDEYNETCKLCLVHDVTKQWMTFTKAMIADKIRHSD